MAQNEFPVGEPDIYFLDQIPPLDELFGIVRVCHQYCMYVSYIFAMHRRR